MAFHFESHGEPATDIDDAGIFTRPLKHVRTFGREILKIIARAFVTSSAPTTSQRKRPAPYSFGSRPSVLDDLLIFVRRETVFGDDLRRHPRLRNSSLAGQACRLALSAQAAAIDMKILAPSSPPRILLHASSG